MAHPKATTSIAWRIGVWAVASAVLALVIAPYADNSANQPVAEATLTLVASEVGWPYHDAVIEEQHQRAMDPAFLASVATVAGIAATDLELYTTVPRNQTFFQVVAELPDQLEQENASGTAGSQAVADVAMTAAEAAADLLIAANLDTRRAPLIAELERTSELAVELEAQAEAANASGDEAAAKVIADRALLAEADAAAIEADLDLVNPQLTRLGQATLVDASSDQWLIGLALWAGLFALGLVAWAAIWPARHR